MRWSLSALGVLVLAGCVREASVARVAAVSPALTTEPLPDGHEEDWPMFRDDPERSGFAEGSTVGPQVDELWHIHGFNTTGYGAVKGSPAIVGDMIYCGTDTGRFVGARSGDGAVVWQIQLDRTSHGIHGSPAIVGDMVFIGAYDGALYALERRTGLLLWRHRQGYQVGSSPVVVPRWGVVYSAHERGPQGGGDVLALDARTGARLWQRPTEAHPHSSVAVDVGRERVFVGDNRGILYAFDARSGQPAWRRELDAGGDKTDIKTTPMVVPELRLVIFGAWSGKVYAVDEDTGEIRWEHATGGRLMGSTAYLPARRELFVGTPRGELLAIDAATGSEQWRFHTNGRIDSSPAVSGDGGAVVFGASDGALYAVRSDSGVLLWRHHLGGVVSGSPALVGDRIYVTSMRGGLWGLVTHG